MQRGNFQAIFMMLSILKDLLIMLLCLPPAKLDLLQSEQLPALRLPPMSTYLKPRKVFLTRPLPQLMCHLVQSALHRPKVRSAWFPASVLVACGLRVNAATQLKIENILIALRCNRKMSKKIVEKLLILCFPK